MGNRRDKLESFGRSLPDFAGDLRTLAGLLEQDPQSALNKMRFIVERGSRDESCATTSGAC